MNKNYVVGFILCLVIGVNAQNFEITNKTNGNAIVNDQDLFNRQTLPETIIEHDFELKNISSSSKVITIRKSEVLVNTVSPGDLALMYFCTGETCYGASVGSASVELAPGETMLLRADLEEASVAGKSEVSYKISCEGQSLVLTIKYTAGAVSIAKNSTLFSSISEVYPNPSSSTSYLNINAPRDINGLSISIINSLGSKVSSKEVNLGSGKNSIALDTENLSSGIYFVSINYGSAVATKKMTVIH